MLQLRKQVVPQVQGTKLESMVRIQSQEITIPYVVDGLVIGNINNINASDISSMEVLKDASATAIYGNRGANGVVLITTKSGSKGKAKIQVDSFLDLLKLFSIFLL